MYRACPNLEAVHVRYVLSTSDLPIGILSLMHTKLVSLKLRSRVLELVSSGDRFISALSACSALEEVDFWLWQEFPEALLRKFFGSLKSVTTFACRMFRPDVIPVKVVIDAMACNLTNLESMTVSTRELMKGDDVNALAGLPRLKSVTLRRLFSKQLACESPEECAAETVKRLKGCAQLVQLEIDDKNLKNRFPRITEACCHVQAEEFRYVRWRRAVSHLVRCEN